MGEVAEGEVEGAESTETAGVEAAAEAAAAKAEVPGGATAPAIPTGHAGHWKGVSSPPQRSPQSQSRRCTKRHK